MFKRIPIPKCTRIQYLNREYISDIMKKPYFVSARSMCSVEDKNINQFERKGFTLKENFKHSFDYTNYMKNLVNYIKYKLLQDYSREITVYETRLQLTPGERVVATLCLKEKISTLLNENVIIVLSDVNHGVIGSLRKILDEIPSATADGYDIVSAELLLSTDVELDRINITSAKLVVFPELTHYNRCTDAVLHMNILDDHYLRPENLRDIIFQGSQPIDETIQVTDSDKLNNSQLTAIKSALSNKITLIQGPPGTGKTHTLACLIRELVNKKHKILVCAPSNVAVANLAKNMHSIGMKVIHILARNKSEVQGILPDYSIEKMVIDQVNKSNNDHLKQLQDKIVNDCYLKESDMIEYMELTYNMRSNIIKNFNIICCTCAMTGSHLIQNSYFDSVVIDEAAQPMEAESLIPLVLGTKKIVLAGDHMQLGPVLFDRWGGFNDFLKLTLFERLLKIGINSIMLDTQYRMHPSLSSFSSQHFYEGKLKDGIVEADRKYNVNINWPIPNVPMFFNAVYGEEDRGHTLSLFNEAEADEIEHIVEHFLDKGVLPSSIGIISPYDAQRHLLSEKIGKKYGRNSIQAKEIEVSSVHAYQGREKDFIFISCVRSNQQKSVGFLVDPYQLNVAITRAKYGLVIVGNPNVLLNSPVWKDYLKFFNNHKLIFTGKFPDLEPFVNGHVFEE